MENVKVKRVGVSTRTFPQVVEGSAADDDRRWLHMKSSLRRTTPCRSDIAVEYLEASEDPEVGLANVARGARAGPKRMLRPPALYKAKNKWIPPEQDPLENLEGEQGGRPAGVVTLLQ